MAGRLTAWGDGLRRRLGDLAPREQRALAALGAFVVVFAVAVCVYLVQSGISGRESRNRANAEVLRMVQDKGRAWRSRMADQDEMNRRLAADVPPLPSIVGEVLGELGQERQDFQELAPEPFGPPNQRRKPWIRLSVKFPLRKVPATVVYDFLLKLRERYPDLPLAVTSLEMRVDRSEEALYNVDMVVSAYRLAEARGEGGREGAGGAAKGGPGEAAGKGGGAP